MIPAYRWQDRYIDAGNRQIGDTLANRLLNTENTFMRLLVVAQAIDRDNQLFAFFVDWLNEAASIFSSVLVFALRINPDSVPKNIQAIPLRIKQNDRNRFYIVYRLLSQSWKHRHEYDAVFVRGDAIYLVIAGWLWRLLGKKVVFWYTHYKAGGLVFWLGVPFAHAVVTASKWANPLSTAVPIGHHISKKWSDASVNRTFSHSPMKAVIVGRVSPVKRVPLIIEALSPLLRSNELDITIIGSPTESLEATKLERSLNHIPNARWQQQGVAYANLQNTLLQYDLLISATPDSLDKVILEAAATGALVIATSRAWADVIRGTAADQWAAPASLHEISDAVKHCLALTPQEKASLSKAYTTLVQEHHGQTQNIQRLHEIFKQIS